MVEKVSAYKSKGRFFATECEAKIHEVEEKLEKLCKGDYNDIYIELMISNRKKVIELLQSIDN